MDIVKGYKVFNNDWKCRSKQYTCPGKFKEDVEPECCEKGMHFCINAADCFNYYNFNSENHVAEVIAHGRISGKGNKCCTDELEIVREIPWEEVLTIVNTGKDCTGLCNTGSWNTGSRNTGSWNTGNRNTGDRNTGSWNTGDYNTGSRNTGSCNTGGYNTGDRNTGSCNTGDYNTGDRNTGDRNTGDCNTGSRNTGSCNTGDWNTGDWNKSSFNNGCFMTEETKIFMFNNSSDWTYLDWMQSNARSFLNEIPKNVVEWVYSEDMTKEEKTAYPTHETTGGYLKVLDGSECAQLWWDGLPDYKKDAIRDLPNFDPEIFEQCTGITV